MERFKQPQFAQQRGELLAIDKNPAQVSGLFLGFFGWEHVHIMVVHYDRRVVRQSEIYFFAVIQQPRFAPRNGNQGVIKKMNLNLSIF